MSHRAGQFAQTFGQTAAVVAAITLFIFRPDWSEHRPLLTGSPAALPQEDGVLQGIFDTKLAAPDWPIKIAAASLVVMPTETSNRIETSVETPRKGGKSAAKAKRRPSMSTTIPTIIVSTKPQRPLQVAERGSKEVKY